MLYHYIYHISLSIPVQSHRNQRKGKGLRFGLDTNPCKIFKLSMICVSRTSSQVSTCLRFRNGLTSLDLTATIWDCAARCCTLSPSRGSARSNDRALLHWQPHTITKLSPCWSKTAPNNSMIPRDEPLQVLPLRQIKISYSDALHKISSCKNEQQTSLQNAPVQQLPWQTSRVAHGVWLRFAPEAVWLHRMLRWPGKMQTESKNKQRGDSWREWREDRIIIVSSYESYSIIQKGRPDMVKSFLNVHQGAVTL